MNPDVVTAAANAVSGVNNGWQVLYAIVAGIMILFGIWLWRRTAESEKLIEAKTETARKETDIRKLERDRQMTEMDSRFAARVEAVNSALKTHIEAHGERDERIQKSVNRLDERLYQIEINMIKGGDFAAMQGDMRKLERLVSRIHAILEMQDVQARTPVINPAVKVANPAVKKVASGEDFEPDE
jgi:hypothetical protein